MQTARATDLTSSQTGYVLSPGDNPFTVVTDARIDTRTNGGIALYGSASQAVTWTLTNHGSIAGAYFAIEFDSFASILNNGPVSSASTTALALYGGGKIVNATGASIVGPRDAVYANAADSVVINAGEMGGSAVDNSSSQAGIHLPSGGTITNLPTGRITGLGSAILADSAATLLNEGAITSLNGVAIDLSASMTGTRTGSVVSNSGSITGRGGTAILFGPNDDTLLITGTSIIVGIVEAGGHSVTGTNTLILGGGDAGSFDISGVGATAQYRGFGTLRKNDSGTWTLTGANDATENWLIGGGAMQVAGRLNGSIVALAGVTGIDIDVLAGGAIQSATGQAIAVNGGSSIVNRGSVSSAAEGVSVLSASGNGTSVDNTGVVASEGASTAAVSIDAPSGVATLTNHALASITSATGVAVVAGSNVSIVNAGTISGYTAAIRLTGSNDRVTLGTGSVVTGDIEGGSGSANALALQGSGTLVSHTSGFETLTLQDADWTLSGPVAIASDSEVRHSALTLTGTLASPGVTIARDSVLRGTGTLTGALTMQGTIAPGVTAPAAATGPQPLTIGTLTVVGSYTQTAGSGYAADVSPQGNDLIRIDGKAVLQGGLVLTRLRAASFVPEDTYTILSTTSGLTGVFSGIETPNPFVSATLAYDANNAYIRVQRGFQYAGGTPNEIAVEAALDHGVAGIATGAVPTRDFLAVAGDLINLEGSSAYAALDQLGAEAYAALPNAHFDAARLTLDAIDDRLDMARATGSCPAGQASLSSTIPTIPTIPTRRCAWISVLGSSGKIGGYDTWLGQQISTAGVVSGIDYRIQPSVTIGAALTAIHGNTSTDSLPVHGQFDTYQTAFYSSYAPGWYWLRASIGYARNDDTMKRSILFTDPSRTALGSVDGNQYFATLSNGVDLPLASRGVLSPFVSLEIQRAETPAFNESGADAMNLAVSANTAQSIRSTLGMRWRGTVDLLGHAWSLTASAAWLHQYGARTHAIDASFNGAPNSGFTVHGSGPSRDAARAGAGISVALGERVHAQLRYDGEFGGGGHTHKASAGFDYRW